MILDVKPLANAVHRVASAVQDFVVEVRRLNNNLQRHNELLERQYKMAEEDIAREIAREEERKREFAEFENKTS